MTVDVRASAQPRGGAFVHANGINIHYVEMGSGEPLVLLHGGVVSAGPAWAGHPFAFVGHMQKLAEHFRVIAPDTRGAGATAHTDGTASYAVLVEDVVAMIDALDLGRTMLCGFSEGGMTASLVSITHPDSVRAIVNDAGYDGFNPQAPSFGMMRQLLGGSPEATEADPDAVQRFFDSSDEMRATFALMKEDHDGAQGEGYWRTYLAHAFNRTTRSPGYTVDDFRRVNVPTLILTGDRDEFCTVEEGVAAFRALPRGELAVLPDHGHFISPAKVQTTIDFLERWEHQRT